MQHPTRYLFILVVLTIWLPCRAQRIVPTLPELIDSAISNDYPLMNQQLAIRQSRLDRQQLQDAFLPRVTVKGEEAFSLTSVVFKTNVIEIPQLNVKIDRSTNRLTLISDRLSLGVDGSMLLYSGGKIPLLKKSVDEKIKAQVLLTEVQKQDIISDVVSTYDQLALLRQVRLVLDESSIRLAADLKIADKAFGYGLITKYERQKIEVAQAQLASSIEAYEGKRGIILEKLYLLTHIPFERLTLIDNNLTPIENILEAQTIDQRADLQAAGLIITAQQFKVRAEGRWRVPRIQALTSLGYTGSYFGHLSSSKPVLPNGAKLSVGLRTLQIAPLVSVGVGFSWTLFDGRDGARQVQRAKLDDRTAQNNRSELAEKLQLNLVKCKTDYVVAISQVITSDRQLQISANALDQATHEYRTGLIRSSDLIDAEEDFRQASLQRWQSVFDQRRAAIDLLKATGKLNSQILP